MNLRVRIYRLGRKLNGYREFVHNVWFFWVTMNHPFRRAIELARNVI